MRSQVLITPVDELVKCVISHPKSSISTLSKMLRIKEDVVEKWVIVLEEQSVFKVEYLGLNSVVSFINHESKKEVLHIDTIKDSFIGACYKRSIPTHKMRELWKQFFIEKELDMKLEFEKESIKKGFDKKKIPLAWSKFRKTLEEL